MQPDEVVQAVLMASRHADAQGVTLGLVSIRRGEGVTYVGQRLSEQLAALSEGRTLFVPSHVVLANKDVLDDAFSRASGHGELMTVVGADARQRDRSPRSPAGPDGVLEANLAALRQFRHVIVDCGDLESGGDGLLVARALTAMLLVVEADRTSKADVTRARQMIERAGGKLLGCVLNKRRYPIPSLVYQLLWGRS
jgi:hypothetical protein